jgi:hypothetical protein
VASGLKGLTGFLTAVGQICKLLVEVLLEVLTVLFFEKFEPLDFTLDRDSLLVEHANFVTLAKLRFSKHARHVVLTLFDNPVALGIPLLDVLVVKFPSELE